MDKNLENQHTGLKMQFTAGNNQVSLILLLSQALQEQAQVGARLMQHAETLMATLKQHEKAEKDSQPNGGSVPGTPPTAS